MEQMLQIVDAHVVVALKDNQIMSVPLVVTKKEVLTMGARKTAPIGAAVLDSRGSGMLGIDKLNAELLKSLIDLWLPNHQMESTVRTLISSRSMGLLILIALSMGT
jgi:hypothetical protein